MARVFTAKAAKDYPDHGIAKGETYYYWTPGFRGRKQMSKTRPRPSQTTSNDKLSQLYAAGEQFEDALGNVDSVDTLVDDLNTYADEVREVAEMYRESFENMPEGLQQGDTGQQMESNADDLETFADELEEAASEIEKLDVEDYIDEDQVRVQAAMQLEDEFEGAEGEEYEEHEDEVERRFREIKSNIKDFDDLSADEKEEMLNAAKEIASGPTCPI